MSMNPYMAHELARTREQELRREAMRHPRPSSRPRREISLRRLRSWSLRAPLPRSATATR